MATEKTATEIVNLFTLYLSKAMARQLMGDLMRSRAALNHAEFRDVMTSACELADRTFTYDYNKPAKEK